MPILAQTVKCGVAGMQGAFAWAIAHIHNIGALWRSSWEFQGICWFATRNPSRYHKASTGIRFRIITPHVYFDSFLLNSAGLAV